jgi:hypothetical protein
MKRLLAEVVRNLRHAPLDAAREVAWRTYLSIGPPTPPDPVLGADWDLLVVLDACRADLFESVVGGGDYDISVGATRISPGSASTEWLDAVFGAAAPDALADLGYVTGNPYTDARLSGSALGYLDEVWRYAWDDALGTIPPRPITDRAIAAGRERDLDRLVVHYMQPHFPPVTADPDAGEGEGLAADEWGDRPVSVWEDLRLGGSVESAWAAYRRNLERVLADVEVLLSNVDAERAVVTADHGNAFGERYIYGHPEGVDLPCLREVPWSVTSAADRGTRTPAAYDRIPDGDADTDAGVDDRLSSLGYRT